MIIAIATMQGENYGNRLQNYALQMALTKEGHRVESLQRVRPSAFRSIKRGLRGIVKNDAITRFREFDSQYIRFSPCALCPDFRTPGIEGRYDKFVIGSDQVWNPTFSFNSSADYLPFVDPSKKLAYAASFGVASLGEKTEEIARLLQDIPHISMREQAGADIVARLTGREVPVVLDPTMLLTPAEWAAVGRRPEGLGDDGPFVFKYVLGDDANAERIQRLADELGAVVVDVADPSLKAGPSEFVWLVANCVAVCTDSFHASVFALLHHRPLAIFERVGSEADMSSRFDTLCGLFGAERCRAARTDFDMGCMGWVSFEEQLSELREASLGWLRGALADGGSRA